MNTPQLCPVFVNGEWQELRNVDTSPVYNPSTGEVIALTPMCTAAHVNEAVEAADAAFPAWWEMPPVERTRVLFRFKMLLEEKFEEIARCNTREHGKTLIESRGDVLLGRKLDRGAAARGRGGHLGRHGRTRRRGRRRRLAFRRSISRSAASAAVTMG